MDLTTILSTPQAPSPAPVTGADPAAAPAPSAAPAEWLNALPEAYRNDPNIQAHKGLEDLLADYNATKTALGRGPDIPAPETPFEQAKDFYLKLGVPESPDKYGIAVPEGFPEELPIDKGFLDQISKIAHENKVPAPALKALADAYFQLEKAALDTRVQASQQELQNRSADIEARWGKNVDTNVEFAKRGYTQFVTAELGRELDAAGISSHPAFLELFRGIGEAMQLPNSPGARSTSGSGVQSQMVTSPAQAQEAIAAFWKDPAKSAAWRNPKDPNHKIYNAELDSYYAKMYS